MNSLRISDDALIHLAQTCIRQIREDADMIRFFSRLPGGGRDSMVRITARRVSQLRPVIQPAVQKFGPEIFRRYGIKKEATR